VEEEGCAGACPACPQYVLRMMLVTELDTPASTHTLSRASPPPVPNTQPRAGAPVEEEGCTCASAAHLQDSRGGARGGCRGGRGRCRSQAHLTAHPGPSGATGAPRHRSGAAQRHSRCVCWCCCPASVSMSASTCDGNEGVCCGWVPCRWLHPPLVLRSCIVLLAQKCSKSSAAQGVSHLNIMSRRNLSQTSLNQHPVRRSNSPEDHP
jgi:hypothetical protein